MRAAEEEGPLFRSSFFLTTKKDGSLRMILNLKPLNKNFVCPKHFRMDTLGVILPTLQKGWWAASVDLKDAYLHIPIHPTHYRFLAFEYLGVDYHFTSLPFGLSTLPRVFTRVAGAVVAYLRTKGVSVFAYLDDWLVLGASRAQAEENVGCVVEVLRMAGLGDQHPEIEPHSITKGGRSWA